MSVRHSSNRACLDLVFLQVAVAAVLTAAPTGTLTAAETGPAAAVTPSPTWPPVVQPPNGEDRPPRVDLRDDALEEVVNRALADNNVPLEELQVLEARDLGIRTLAGLEAASGLREVNLSSNRIRDLQPLSNLMQLRELLLAGNRISDLGPLTQIKSLEVLDLGGNQVTDLGALLGLHRLRALDLRRTQIDQHSLQPLLSSDLEARVMISCEALETSQEDLQRLAASITVICD